MFCSLQAIQEKRQKELRLTLKESMLSSKMKKKRRKKVIPKMVNSFSMGQTYKANGQDAFVSNRTRPDKIRDPAQRI